MKLYVDLGDVATPDLRRERTLPGSPRALSNALIQVEPALMRFRIQVERIPANDRKRTRIICLLPLGQAETEYWPWRVCRISRSVPILDAARLLDLGAPVGNYLSRTNQD